MSQPAYILRQGKKTLWEARLLEEFLQKEYPTTPYSTNPRVGALPPEFEAYPLTPKQARMLNPKKRFPDAILYLPDKTIILEAKMKSDPGNISKLQIYRKLFLQTPEFKERRTLPIELMLVYVVEDPPTIQDAREAGIRCIQHVPRWVNEWINKQEARRRPALEEALLPATSQA